MYSSVCSALSLAQGLLSLLDSGLRHDSCRRGCFRSYTYIYSDRRHLSHTTLSIIHAEPFSEPYDDEGLAKFFLLLSFSRYRQVPQVAAASDKGFLSCTVDTAFLCCYDNCSRIFGDYHVQDLDRCSEFPRLVELCKEVCHPIAALEHPTLTELEGPMHSPLNGFVTMAQEMGTFLRAFVHSKILVKTSHELFAIHCYLFTNRAQKKDSRERFVFEEGKKIDVFAGMNSSLVSLFHGMVMNPKQGRDELLKNVEEDAFLTFNAPQEDIYLGSLVNTYTGKQGFIKFLAREGEIWNDGGPSSYFVKEMHRASSTNTVSFLTEMAGVVGKKEEEVLIRCAEIWTFSAVGKIVGARLFATPYYENSERLPPKMAYLTSRIDTEDSRKSKKGEERLSVDPMLADKTGPRINHFGIHGGNPA